MANKFKKGDKIIVIAGSNKGKIGSITSIKNQRVLIGGINLSTIHKKPNSNNPGQIIRLESYIHISNISHIEDGKPVKVTFNTNNEVKKGFKVKEVVSKKTGKKISS